jgi:hypothetical protein
MHDYIFSVFPKDHFIDLGLYQYGWEQCKPSHSFGPIARNHYLFHYVLSGSGRLMVNDESDHTTTYQIRSGQGFMLFPDQVAMYAASQDHPWEYVWLEFDGLRVKESMEQAGLSPEHPVYHARSHDLRKSMQEEMLYIVHSKDETPSHLIGHLYLFLDYFTRSAAPPAPAHSQSNLRDFYFKEAVSFIEQNFQNDISVEDIAAACGLNRSYFGKIFKETVGKTPQEFLMSYRMIKATDLLKLTNL